MPALENPRLRLAAVAVKHYLNADHPANLKAFWLAFGASILPEHTVETALRWIEEGRGRAYVAERLMYRIKRHQPKRADLPEAKGWGVVVPVLEHLRNEPVRDREDRAQLFTMVQEIAHLRPLFYALLVRAAWEGWGRTDRKRFHIFVRRILHDFPRIEQEEDVARLAYGDLRPEPERVGSLRVMQPTLRGWDLGWLEEALEESRGKLGALDRWVLEEFLGRPAFALMHVGETHWGTCRIRWTAFGRARLSHPEERYFVVRYRLECATKRGEGVALIGADARVVHVSGPRNIRMLRRVAKILLGRVPRVKRWVRPNGQQVTAPERMWNLVLPRPSSGFATLMVRGTLEGIR